MLKKFHTHRRARSGVIIVTLGLLVGIGYSFWLDYSEGQQAVAPSIMTSGDGSSKVADHEKRYTTDRYSFAYPIEGWLLRQGDEATGNNPSLETSDLTLEGFDIKTGAGIYIRTFPSSEGITYDQLVKNPDGLPEGIYTDIKKATLDKIEGQSYTLNYEGTRYITEAARGDTTYQIIFKVAKDQKTQYDEVYRQVVTSFKFK